MFEANSHDAALEFVYLLEEHGQLYNLILVDENYDELETII